MLDYTVIKTIGKGGFSSVLLGKSQFVTHFSKVRNRHDGLLRAMKLMNKERIQKEGKLE